MPTRLYFHEALSELTNLPTTRNSDAPGSLGNSADAENVNRTMDTNIGSSWTTKTINTVASTVNLEYYFTKFVSPALAAQTINTNTWKFDIATYYDSGLANFPRNGSGAIYLCCYLWRPGTGLVGYIIDGDSNTDAIESGFGSYRSQNITFSGASQTAQAGDVIVFELVASITQSSAASRDIRYAYDGTTVYSTPGTDTSGDIAAFIETPQDLTFGGGMDPIEMDVTDTVVLTNKFIDKA